MKSESCDLLCLDASKAESLRTSRVNTATAERLAALGKALSDPTRLTVAIVLRDGGELCVCDLAWVLERSDKLISHHLGVLKIAGLVTSRRDGKMVMYALTESGRELLAAVGHDEEVAV
jgi:DNA-binding transcriptional ArsR family regulator